MKKTQPIKENFVLIPKEVFNCQLEPTALALITYLWATQTEGINGLKIYQDLGINGRLLQHLFKELQAKGLVEVQECSNKEEWSAQIMLKTPNTPPSLEEIEEAQWWELVTGLKDYKPFTPQLPKDIQKALKGSFAAQGLTINPPNAVEWFVLVKDADLAQTKATLETPDFVFDTGPSLDFLKRLVRRGDTREFLHVRVERDGSLGVCRESPFCLEGMAKEDTLLYAKEKELKHV